jgi:metal-dependent amidase/aminoacylase/carboxypeptidase family protein
VWGRVSAGSAANAIPDSGVVEGTVRCLDDDAWQAVPEMMKELVESVSTTYGVTGDLHYERSVPPAMNEEICTAMVAAAADWVLGPDAVTAAPQSLGGEDFAWYLESIPGSLFRLGTRRPGSVEEFDIHQPMFDVDERCIAVGVKVMTATALTAIGAAGGRDALLATAGRAKKASPIGSVVPVTGKVRLAGPLLAACPW